MKDEVKYLTTVESEYQKKVLVRKLHKKFGVNIFSSNSIGDKWKIGAVDDGSLVSELLDTMRGYAMGVLEWIQSVEASS